MAIQINGTTVVDDSRVLQNLGSALSVSNGGTGATSLTANNVLLGNGTSAVQVVAPGTNGNVLTSNGTTWVSSTPGGGDYVKISTTTISSGVLYVDVTNVFSSTYRNYVIFFNNLSQLTYSRKYAIQAIVSSGSVQTGYFAGRSVLFDNRGTSSVTNLNGSDLQIVDGQDPDNSIQVSAVWTLIFPFSSSAGQSSSGTLFSGYRGVSYANSCQYAYFRNYGYNTEMTGFRLITESPSTLNSGTIVIYGMK